jgi:tetratricopeptide (TPR) repeat protein
MWQSCRALLPPGLACAGKHHERRRALQARIVEALEGLSGDRLTEQVERLAHHALRGEVRDKALEYCRQAGEKAMVQSAYSEAVGYFEQALGAVPHLPEQLGTREQAIDLRLALRTALQPLGDIGRVLVYLREAESLAEALDDSRRLAQVSVFLIIHFIHRGAYAQAIAVAQRALALATASGDVALQAVANLYLGGTYIIQGDYRQAIGCLRQTMATLDGARRRELFDQVSLPSVQCHGMLAWCHAELGTFAEGSAFGAEGLRIAETTAHPVSLTWAYYGIGWPSRGGACPRRAYAGAHS